MSQEEPVVTATAESLQRELSLLRAVIENMPDACYVKDLAGRYVYFNGKSERVWGRSAQETIGCDETELIGTEAAAIVLTQDRRIIATGLAETEEQVVFACNDARVLQVTKSPFRDAQGVIQGILGIARYVTPHGQAEEAIRKAATENSTVGKEYFQELVMLEDDKRAREIRFRDLVDAIPQIVWVAGPDGAMLHLNAKASEYTGVETYQLVGWSWDKVIHPDDLATTMEQWTACLRDGIAADIALRILRHDGEYRWHICRQIPARDESGTVTLWYGTCTDVEELKRAQYSLRESEERFRLLYEGAADAIFWADAETGLLIQCNRAAEDLLGLTRDQILGQHQSFLYPPDEAKRCLELLHQHTMSSSQTAIEVEVLRQDGQRVDVAISPSVAVINGQRVTQGIFRNISAYKRTQQSLQMMRFCVDHAGDSVFWVNRQGAILYANEAACTSQGYAREDLLTMSVFELDVEPDYQPDRWEIHFDDLKRRQSITFESTHRAKDGRIFPVEINANYVYINNQEFNFAFVRDITQRRQRGEKIAQLAAIVESSEDAIFATTPSGMITSWNRGATSVFGFHENEIAGRSFATLMPADNGADIANILNRISNGEHIEHFECKACRNDGSQIDVALTISPVGDMDSRFVGASIVARNVTERKQAESERLRVEQDLRRSEERFSKLFYASPFSILVATYPDGKIVEVNDAFLRLFEFERSEVIGQTTADLKMWVDPAAREAMIDRLRHNESSRDMEIAFRSKTGALLTLLMSVEIIHLHGQPHSLAMSIDITVHKQIEEQLRQSQKMEAIGQLAGGVAHDFNNLLTVINGYCDMLLAKQSDQNRWTASVQEIREAGRRASELTEQLLAFSRRSYSQRKVVHLDDVVAGAEKLLRRLIGEQIILTVQPGTKNSFIEADVNQLEQVLMNLAVNARDAMPNGGHLTITTINTLSSDSVISLWQGERGEFVQLDITDTGVGMTDQIQSKVFEPFFTTKAIGKGSGLGLAVVHGIIQQNNGKIRIRSTPGQGTTISMIFPVVDEAPGNEVRTINTTTTGGSETILFVEDEPGVRKFVRTVLELQGYKVLIASDGYEAISLAKLSREPIHLLLTDVVMPGIAGHLVAESLRSDIPTLKVIYISGYAESEYTRERALNARDTFLQKPFTPQELLAKVREHIDAGRTR